MKKYVIVCLISFIIGGTFAYFMLKDVSDKVDLAFKDSSEAKAFQIGVYSSFESANELANQYASAKIVESDGFYRVYLAVLENEECIEKMQIYFNEKNIDTYLKKININDNLKAEIKKYEKILLESPDKGTYEAINQKIMESYKKSSV